MITCLSGRGFHTSMTALQIRRANSISVPVKLSGEYSKRKLVSGILAAYSSKSLAPDTAMSTISSSLIRKTCAPLGEGGGVVQVDHHVFGALDGIEGLFLIIWGRDWVSTWMETSSGIRWSSMMVRRNSYSVSEAVGEAHLDLLEPHLQQSRR